MNSLQSSLKWLLAAVVVGLSLFQGWGMVESLRREKGGLVAKEDVRRLSKITLQFFSRGTPPSDATFWATVGKEEPLRDPWGTAYRLDPPVTGEFTWRSAGSDRKYQTADDLVSRVPIGEGLDFSVPAPAPVDGPLSTDAL